jgi:hypothetical protein
MLEIMVLALKPPLASFFVGLCGAIPRHARTYTQTHTHSDFCLQVKGLLVKLYLPSSCDLLNTVTII